MFEIKYAKCSTLKVGVGKRSQHNKLKTFLPHTFPSIFFASVEKYQQNVLPLKYEKLLNNSGCPGAV